MPDRLMTIYNHGTGTSRKSGVANAEIVNIFSNGHLAAPKYSTEFVDVVITEGVASEGKPHEWEIVIDEKGNLVRKNLLKMTTGEVVLAVLAPPVWAASALAKAIANSNAAAAFAGKGVEENVRSVRAILEWAFANDVGPTEVNMLGWSRGAVTCNRIAYQMSTATKWARDKKTGAAIEKIPVRIFAVDPVAGPGREADVDAITLGANVKTYVMTLALGEDRRGFKPIDDTRLKVTKATSLLVIPLHGIHGDTAEWTNPSGHITFNLAYRFLAANGTSMGTALGMFKQGNAAQLLAYGKLKETDAARLHKSDQVKKHGFWEALFTGGGKVARDIDTTRYVSDEFFVNAHHQALFMKEYNQCYRAFFGTGRPTRNKPEWRAEWDAKIAPELKKMKEVEVLELRALDPMPHFKADEAARGQTRQAVITANKLVD